MGPIDGPRNEELGLLGNLETQAHFLGPKMWKQHKPWHLAGRQKPQGAGRITCAELLEGSSACKGTSSKLEYPKDHGIVARRGGCHPLNQHTYPFPFSIRFGHGKRRKEENIDG
ncbi:hypothetical protein ACE6H2_010441 [Prunus campanulata]